MSDHITWKMFEEQFENFYNRITDFANELNIFSDITNLSIDHAGLRIADPKHVDILRDELLNRATLFSKDIVNGREILLFQLHTPLSFGEWKIPCVELPYPKPTHNYKDGWEHVEVVIPSETSDLKEMQDTFILQFPYLNIDDLKERYDYSEDMPEAELDQLPNPTISIRKEKNTCIKFHPQSIQEVVGFVK